MKNARKKYSIEFKIWAIKTSMGYKSIRLAADKLQINKNSLQHWKNHFRDGRLSLQKATGWDSDKKEIAGLRKEIKNIRLERDILKEGAGHLHQPRKAMYRLIMENTGRFPIVKICRIFQIEPSCYYKWLKGLSTSRSERRIFIASEISRIYHWSQGRYGSPKISKELAALGITVCPSLVRKIMAEQKLRWITKLKFKRTTLSSSKYPAAENLLNQDFKAARQNQVWVSDITYIRTVEGWAYLTTVIDLFDRKVIGWSLSKTLKSMDTSVAAFRKALLNHPLLPYQKLKFHSDRGIQYACKNFTYLLSKNKQILQSMSRKGNCYDNAVAESFFKTLKTELVCRYKYKNRKQAGKSIHDYIENFYNTVRRHSALGNLTMEEFQNKHLIS
ncbi:IS3 family transposase [Flavobacterium pectinovorum]|uniref:IS3 family transposase n=1 Tax=Flavobacterium pectinovorum TaxID=29533 RepID=UPI00265F3977|nr:IS3 family transposase [Flavobacterium pectinovorum]WKL49636.1 IS3 family transposase [Flavobacterium pectinovorum]